MLLTRSVKDDAAFSGYPGGAPQRCRSSFPGALVVEGASCASGAIGVLLSGCMSGVRVRRGRPCERAERIAVLCRWRSLRSFSLPLGIVLASMPALPSISGALAGAWVGRVDEGLTGE